MGSALLRRGRAPREWGVVPTLSINRVRSPAGGWRRWSVLVDESLVGKVANDSLAEFEVAAGHHVICLKAPLRMSEPIAVTIPDCSFVQLRAEPDERSRRAGLLGVVRPSARVERLGPGAREKR